MPLRIRLHVLLYNFTHNNAYTVRRCKPHLRPYMVPRPHTPVVVVWWVLALPTTRIRQNLSFGIRDHTIGGCTNTERGAIYTLYRYPMYLHVYNYLLYDDMI